MVVKFLVTNVNTFFIVYAFSQMYSLFGIGKLFLNFLWKPTIWMECCPNNFMLYVMAQKKDRILAPFTFLLQREQSFMLVYCNFKIFKWNEFDVIHFNNNRKTYIDNFSIDMSKIYIKYFKKIITKNRILRRQPLKSRMCPRWVSYVFRILLKGIFLSVVQGAWD